MVFNIALKYKISSKKTDKFFNSTAKNWESPTKVVLTMSPGGTSPISTWELASIIRNEYKKFGLILTISSSNSRWYKRKFTVTAHHSRGNIHNLNWDLTGNVENIYLKFGSIICVTAYTFDDDTKRKREHTHAQAFWKKLVFRISDL